MPEPVLFDTPLPNSDAMVTRTGLLFRAGSYPEDAWAITPAELAAAAARFTQPVANELEHYTSKGDHTILDGKLGRTQRVWVDGDALYGEVQVPAWLDPIWSEYGRKVSTAWDRSTKTLARVGLVVSPRIPDAALMSAPSDPVLKAYAAFAGSRHSAKDAADIQQIHTLAVQQGAICTEPPAVTMPGALYSSTDAGVVTHSTSGGVRMKLKEFIYGKAAAEGVTLEEEPTAAPAPDPEVAQLKAQLATFAHQAEEGRKAQQAKDAVMFAQSMVKEGKILPAGADALAALYASLAAQSDTVTFSDGSTKTGTEVLAVVFAALPAHSLTTPMPLDGTMGVLAPQSTSAANGNGKMTPERRAELIAKSPLGHLLKN